MNNIKPKVLVCAYACLGAPDKRFDFADGGEAGLGWSIIGQLDKFCQLFVLTHGQNQQFIEPRLSKKKINNTNFYYIKLPRYLDFLQKIGGGVQIYAYLWQIKAYFVARKLHKEIKFDIFHHITFANDWMASFIGALLPIPHIRGPGGGAHKVPKEFVEEYPLKDKIAQKIRSIGQWLFRHDPFFIIGQNRAKAILVCNKESFNALLKKWQKKAYFFPVSGVSEEDLGLIHSQGENFDKFSIITAGRLIKIKGFDLAIQTFAVFAKKNPNSELVIIGDGPEFVKLKNLSAELKIENKVKFGKWIPRENLLKKMATSDVFLFLSLRDGGAVAVVEAMAMGKPVVCFDIAGPAFHIDENCGIKIKPTNPEQAIEDVTRALEKLYSDQDLKEALGKNARRKVEENYAWDKLGERLQEIYKKFL